MRIGIDLGGTKIEGILLAPDGTEQNRVRKPTPQGDYDATIKTIVDVVSHLETGLDTKVPVGIGMPGTLSPSSGRVINANSVCLIGKPLDQDLRYALNRPVRLENDANCFAVSESHDGAGKGAQVVFGVILGTGVGGGIAINGAAHIGHNAIAGEWGHNPLPRPQIINGQDERPGPDCYCGRTGCIETFLSGPGLCQDHTLHTQTLMTCETIVEQARNTDPSCQKTKACQDTLDRYEHRLARALSTVINILDPDVIVLGGGLSNIQRLYTNVPKLWSQWVFSDHATTRLVPNVHGDSSGVRGAAWLWA